MQNNKVMYKIENNEQNKTKNDPPGLDNIEFDRIKYGVKHEQICVNTSLTVSDIQSRKNPAV